MDEETELRRAVGRFYDDYHAHRARVPDKWVHSVYWPALLGSVLEVGGGTLTPQRDQYTLVDLSFQATLRAFAAGIPAAVADGTRQPFPDATFDTVACYDVLEHILDTPAFLGEMCRLAKRRVIIAGPNFVGGHPGGVSRFLPLRLAAYLSGSGKNCPRVDNPHLTFDDEWAPDRDAICRPNAGWVADQLRLNYYRVRFSRSWEYTHHWLNIFPAIRCLGPFMFVVGDKQ